MAEKKCKIPLLLDNENLSTEFCQMLKQLKFSLLKRGIRISIAHFMMIKKTETWNVVFKIHIGQSHKGE